jgi:hypothetical protein
LIVFATLDARFVASSLAVHTPTAAAPAKKQRGGVFGFSELNWVRTPAVCAYQYSL